MAQQSRPLSPHLEIYKPQITMVMSIVHRITGVGLFLGFALLTWWLVAAAWGEGALELVNATMGSLPGQVILLGFTWALFHHMLGGIRHFIWDFGRGFSEKSRFGLAWFTIIGGLVLAGLVRALVAWV